MLHVPLKYACLLSVSVFLSCSSGGNLSSECRRSRDCDAGEVCVDELCVKVCTLDSQCDRGEQCALGVCVAVGGGECRNDGDCSGAHVCQEGACVAPPLEPPSIESVSGSGSLDPDPDHAERRIRDRLVITGRNLVGSTVTLTGTNPTVPSADLRPCGEADTATHLEVMLPPGLADGEYSLTIANQAGSCDASLRILQGEPGSLQASGTELVEAVVTTVEADPTLKLPGALVGQITTIFAAASSVATGRQILIDGVNQVDSSAAGLYLVVLDLSDHSVYDVQATTLFRSKGAFAAGVQLEQDGLRDVLATLNDQHVVILASTGNISAMGQDQGLATQMRAYGASTDFENTTADQSYLLIGSKNIGEGNGLEQIAGPERSGTATIGTVAVDQSVVGLVTDRGMPSGMVGFFDGRCPPGWTPYTAAEGRTVVGATDTGALGATVGATLGEQAQRTISEVPSHSHQIDAPATNATTSTNGSHSHTISRVATVVTRGTNPLNPAVDRSRSAKTIDNPATSAAGSHAHTVSIDIAPFASQTVGSAAVDVTMPYVQLRPCRKD